MLSREVLHFVLNVGLAKAPCCLRWLHLDTVILVLSGLTILLWMSGLQYLLAPRSSWFSFVETSVKRPLFRWPWETLSKSSYSLNGSCSSMSIHIRILNESIVFNKGFWTFYSCIQRLIIKELRLIERYWLSQVNIIIMGIDILLTLVDIVLWVSVSTEQRSCCYLLPIIGGLYVFRSVVCCSCLIVDVLVVLLLNRLVKRNLCNLVCT